MAKDKKSFILYSDLIHTVNKLPNDKAGELFKHILSYVNDEEPETDDIIINISFEPIKQQLKRDLQKWEGIRIKRSEAGKASAEKRKQKQQVLTSVENVQQSSTNPTVSVNDNVNVTVNVNDINKRKQAFSSLINKTILDSREKYKNNKQDLIDFYEYWTEHGINDKKMRFEKQTSFSVERRLDTWFKNKEKFNNNTTGKITDQSVCENINLHPDRMKIK